MTEPLLIALGMVLLGGAPFLLFSRRDSVRRLGVAAVLLGLAAFAAGAILIAGDKSERVGECRKAGGELVGGVCIDRDVIIR